MIKHNIKSKSWSIEIRLFYQSKYLKFYDIFLIKSWYSNASFTRTLWDLILLVFHEIVWSISRQTSYSVGMSSNKSLFQQNIFEFSNYLKKCFCRFMSVICDIIYKSFKRYYFFSPACAVWSNNNSNNVVERWIIIYK